MIYQTKERDNTHQSSIIHRIANEKLEAKQNIQFQSKAGVIFYLTHIQCYSFAKGIPLYQFLILKKHEPATARKK